MSNASISFFKMLLRHFKAEIAIAIAIASCASYHQFGWLRNNRFFVFTILLKSNNLIEVSEAVRHKIAHTTEQSCFAFYNLP